VSSVLVWLIAAGMIAGMLFRPKQWPEAVWACAGAVLLVVLKLISPFGALRAIQKGIDVYLFLTGMMLLAELARQEGVFDWLATLAVRKSRGSADRLFRLVYTIGIAVTVFLSNDATAVVLTPAVYAAVKKCRAKPLPYLFICAFIANAASFVLPISNPANLVVYGRQLPALVPWVRLFAVPSVLAIGITYVVLRWLWRRDLSQAIEDDTPDVHLSATGRKAFFGISGTAAILMVASGLGWDLGLPTCLAATFVVLIATRGDPGALIGIARHVSWAVLPLVAGLFVLVDALNGAGALHIVGGLLNRTAGLWPPVGCLAASFSIAGLSNVMNNLPSGLLAGDALQHARVPDYIRHAVLIGIDLGPNLSVSGSLATILWLIALRREGEHVTAWEFLKAGALVMPPALLLASLALLALAT
jgi:arsenical pump membrane protein